MEAATARGIKPYAEIKGFGVGFRGKDGNTASYLRTIEEALTRSGLRWEDIDILFCNSAGRPQDPDFDLLSAQFSGDDVSICCLNDRLGYGESTSALIHLNAAAELIALSRTQPDPNPAIAGLLGSKKQVSLRAGG